MKNLRVLHIDDERVERRLMKALLVDEGDEKSSIIRDCDWTSIGEPFNDMREYESFHIILIDWKLTGTTGTAVARSIREAYPDKKLMLLSGIADQLPPEAVEPFDCCADKNNPTQIWGNARALVDAVVKPRA